MKKLLISFVLIILSIGAFAQNVTDLSDIDKAYIKREAETVIKRYNQLLNNLGGIPKSKDEVIPRLDIQVEELFASFDVKIQSDVNPLKGGLDIDASDVVEIRNYLNQVFQWYDNNSSTIVFDNINIRRIYNVKDGILSVKVFFDSYWGGVNKHITSPYGKNKRVAELLVKKEGQIWRCYISHVYFYEKEKSVVPDIPIQVLPSTPSPSPPPVADGMLTKKELENFEDKAKQKVIEFYDLLDYLGKNKNNTQEVKETIDDICALFIDNNVTMQVNSIKNAKAKTYKLKKYLQRFAKMRYDVTDISIDTLNLGLVGGWILCDDGTYKGMMTTYQFFIGKRGNQIRYSDQTPKQVEVIVKQKERQTIVRESNWEVVLGNIKIIGPAIKLD